MAILLFHVVFHTLAPEEHIDIEYVCRDEEMCINVTIYEKSRIQTIDKHRRNSFQFWMELSDNFELLRRHVRDDAKTGALVAGGSFDVFQFT